ncbi:hypothetical protein [Actinokineospora iranica]|uniref:Uncharacterized protein n=1 Tax=Actinokineospora iranica TaxID=1271860 RepID=A0A1G6V3C2_9PSEU|nr:hypothetical protein [Actinokineospora iranica]SDD48120.1 hypothetical protein SAMN05216174_111226 [Actinokineospora iranica]
MIDETDPAIRAVRAPFQAISAGLGDRFEATAAAYREKIAEHERYVAERTAREARLRAEPVPERPKRPTRPRREPDDPSETGFYTVTWMTKR